MYVILLVVLQIVPLLNIKLQFLLNTIRFIHIEQITMIDVIIEWPPPKSCWSQVWNIGGEIVVQWVPIQVLSALSFCFNKDQIEDTQISDNRQL